MFRPTLVLAAIACLSSAAVSAPAFAADEEEIFASIEEMHGDAEGFFELYSQVQDAVLLDMPENLATAIAYPITIEANGETYDVAEPQDVVDNFDTLISEKVQKAIGSQDVGDLIITSEGVGLSAGDVWFTNICLDDACADTEWAVITINN